MRIAVALLLAMLFCSPAAAQWSSVPGMPNDIYNTSLAYVGVNCYPWRGHFHVVSSVNNGIWGETSLSNGSGVAGYNSNSSSTAGAVFGWTAGTAGLGVYGLASSTTGANTGVWGASASATGVGVAGRADNASGGTALFGGVTSANAYALYASGGRNYLSGNTGIGTATPATKLHVNGTVRLENTGSLTTASANLAAIDSSGNIVQQAPPFGNGIREYTANGDFDVPNGVTRVRVRMWGGGGAGNGAGIQWAGGAGGYIEAVLEVTGGAQLNIVVGTRGNPVAGATGGAGSATTIAMSGTTLLTAGGGGGGTVGNPNDGGAGGTATKHASIAADRVLLKSGKKGTNVGDVFTPPAYSGLMTMQTTGSLGNGRFISAGTGGAASWSGADGAVVLEW